MEHVTTHEAKTHLSQLLARVQKGEEFVICRGQLPIARLVPHDPQAQSSTRPRVGTVTSAPISYTPDAFDPMTDGELETWGL